MWHGNRKTSGKTTYIRALLSLCIWRVVAVVVLSQSIYLVVSGQKRQILQSKFQQGHRIERRKAKIAMTQGRSGMERQVSLERNMRKCSYYVVIVSTRDGVGWLSDKGFTEDTSSEEVGKRNRWSSCMLILISGIELWSPHNHCRATEHHIFRSRKKRFRRTN